MFSEEHCPSCESGDYDVLGYFEDATDKGYSREWSCKCKDCNADFNITYNYDLVQILVTKGE